MNVLAVIPARSGSVGVPHKNIRQCGGKPLMAWSIEAALASRLITHVVVSSDSEAYLQVASRHGAEVVLRPAELAHGQPGDMDRAIGHAIRTFRAEAPEWVVTLQPTVPDRRPGLIDECIRRAWDTEADCCFTAEPLPYTWWRQDNAQYADDAVWVTNNPRQVTRQAIHPRGLHWKQDGSVYVTRTSLLVGGDALPGCSWTPKKIGGRIQVQPNDWTIDIDTEAQFMAANAMLAARPERTVA